jgi:dsDNA-specific endonuclease/ATPase MutS2
MQSTWTKSSHSFNSIISTSSSELASIITQLQTQSRNFDVCSLNTAEMLQRSAWTSEKTQQFLNVIPELDKEALQKLADELHSTVQQTKNDVLNLVNELRSINSAIDAVSMERSLVTLLSLRSLLSADHRRCLPSGGFGRRPTMLKCRTTDCS